jgi:RNA polymerase sigma factor (TIGR02999 family)
MATESGRVTRLLLDLRRGNGQAFEKLFPLVYDELRRIAHFLLRKERANHTLGTTALVHECYLRLVDHTRCSYNDRAHFLAVAARAMRRLLIDYARKRNALKRGGKQHRVSLEQEMISIEEQAHDLLALDQALDQLAERSPRMSRIVECRFFGGLTVKETAGALDISPRTVQRDWTRAKAYLHRALKQ